MCLRRAVLALVVLSAGVIMLPAAAAADDDDGTVVEETHDDAIPSRPPADTRPAAAAASGPADATAADEITILAAPVGFKIEDFWYDELELEGTAGEICVGGILDGTLWAFYEVVDRFGGLAGTIYACRERYDAANDPDCNGTVVDPSTNPSFFSTCWSNHARGRAFDVLVGGSAGSGYNTTRGLNIVNWLLATDAQGNVNSVARRMGVQQILFEDRCWNSDGDRGISSWSKMRECGIGHHDHVHVDMTLRGAAGTVSYWGGPLRPPAPKPDTQVFWDLASGYRQAISWWNLQTTDEEGLVLPAGYDRAVVGDWDSNGETGEIFLWDKETGNYFVQEWNGGDALNARMGNLGAGVDDIVAGDWDGDGEVDDMFLWDAELGRWNVFSWDNYEPTYRRRGTWTVAPDDFTAGDFDGDGRVDDMHVWDHTTGAWNVFSWNNFLPTYRGKGSFSRTFDELLVGDWSAGGEMDESVVWDRNGGQWILYTWEAFRLTRGDSGIWSVVWDIAAIGDYDTDGRTDDLFLYNNNDGRWVLYSFHRNVIEKRLTGDWGGAFDVISVGPFNE